MRQKEWNPESVRDQIQLRAIQLQRPLTCTMELTCRCNFHCRMCYVRMNGEQSEKYGRHRSVEEWISLAEQMRNAGVFYLTLTGGECTLYPGFERLYEQLCRMGFRITVMSNAGAYTNSIRDVFRKYPPCNIGITLYGGSNETYEAVTGDPQGYVKVVENICFLKSLGVPVGLNFTMIRQNVLDYPKIVELCKELGLPFTLITDICGHRYDRSFSEALECRLSPAERACAACYPPEEIGIAMTDAWELEKELEHFRMPEAKEGTNPPGQDTCIGSQTGCAIAWNGEMQTCISMLGYRSVFPFEVGFEAAWAQLKAMKEENFRKPEACAECEMAADCMHNCAGRRFEGTGTPGEPDPYTCQYTYLLRICREKRKTEEIAQAPGCV